MVGDHSQARSSCKTILQLFRRIGERLSGFHQGRAPPPRDFGVICIPKQINTTVVSFLFHVSILISFIVLIQRNEYQSISVTGNIKVLLFKTFIQYMHIKKSLNTSHAGGRSTLQSLPLLPTFIRPLLISQCQPLYTRDKWHNTPGANF